MLVFVSTFACSSDDRKEEAGAAGEVVEVYQEGDTLVIRNPRVRLEYALEEGLFAIFKDADSRKGAEVPLIGNASSMVYSHVLVPAHRWSSSDLPFDRWVSEKASNVLGKGMSVTVHRGPTEDSPAIAQTFTLLAGSSCVLSHVRVLNTASKDIKVGAIYPLFSETDSANLFFGENSHLRVLSNGVLNYLEIMVPILPGTLPCLSNWSSLIFNQETGDSLSVGFLTYEMAQPLVYSGPVFGSGKEAGQVLQAVSQYEPAKILGANQSLTSELMILDAQQETPHVALETYADRLKAWLGIETWLERHPEMKVPAGWNSWSGSGSSGGYGTDINEEIIVANMDFADRELRRWGMNYFQIDDGWEVNIGDWWVREDRFPSHGDQNGIEWLLARARDLGFIPGLWIQAFNAEEGSETLANHPEWFCDPIFGGLFGDDLRALDLSRPDAREHLGEIVGHVRDWGAEWVKLDFGYTAALTENWHESNITRGEFYKKGVQLVRDTLGNDVFFLNVAIVGWNYGLIDSLRLTLDTMPAWEGESDDPYSLGGYFLNQGLKPMYRDSVRRYYLHGRVWLNHPDLTFYRAHRDTSIPPLTLNESSTFTTAVALQGGVVKIGDRIVDLSSEAVDNLRRILPVYGTSGRPLDLFQREFPEVWSMTVDDFDEPYHVLGLLNWGINLDLTRSPYAFMDDAERVIGADFDAMELDPDAVYLAFEFWTQEFLGEASGEFSMTVPARTPRVVALRRKLARPQLLGTNRHVIGGVGVIRSVEWNAGTRTLTGVQEGSIGTAHAPFEHRVTLYVPDSYTFQGVEVTAPDGYQIQGQASDVDGRVMVLRFSVTESAKETGSWHPDVTWKAVFE